MYCQGLSYYDRGAQYPMTEMAVLASISCQLVREEGKQNNSQWEDGSCKSWKTGQHSNKTRPSRMGVHHWAGNLVFVKVVILRFLERRETGLIWRTNIFLKRMKKTRHFLIHENDGISVFCILILMFSYMRCEEKIFLTEFLKFDMLLISS
jgi:hypothetical protein